MKYHLILKKYFNRLALSVAEAFKLHDAQGLWKRIKKDEKQIRDWGNTSEHCLVEVARSDEFAELFKFNVTIRKQLKIAAGIHDVGKPLEKKAIADDIQSGGSGFAGVKKSTDEISQIMRDAGFGNETITLANAPCDYPTDFFITRDLLKHEYLSDEEIATWYFSMLTDIQETRNGSYQASKMPPGKRLMKLTGVLKKIVLMNATKN